MKNTTRMMMMMQRPVYSARLRQMFGDNLIGYYPGDEVSGTVLKDASGNVRNGAITASGVSYRQSQMTDHPCLLLDGTAGYCNLYGAALAAAFNGKEGGIDVVIFPDLDAWTDGTQDTIFVFQVDGNNSVQLYKSSGANNQLLFYYRAGGTTAKSFAKNFGVVPGVPFHLGITWSFSTDQLVFTFNGRQQDAIITTLGEWAGALASNRMLWGSATTTAVNTLKGKISDLVIVNRFITEAERFMMAGVSVEQVSAPGAGNFTIIQLGDPHLSTAAQASILNTQMNWIVANKTTLNIQAVLCGGDLMNDGGVAGERVYADAALDILDAGNVPYMVSPGNHDYDTDGSATRAVTGWLTAFPAARYTGAAWWAGGLYEAGHSENAYNVFTIGGVEYLFITLEFGPRQAVVDWADALITTHAEKPTIIVTHSYLYNDGTRTGTGDTYNPHTYPVHPDCHDGDELWTELVKLHENIIAVLCGHDVLAGSYDAGTVARLVSTGDNANPVVQILANYQDFCKNGFLRVLKINPTARTITAETYSPTTKGHLTDTANIFTESY